MCSKEDVQKTDTSERSGITLLTRREWYPYEIWSHATASAPLLTARMSLSYREITTPETLLDSDASPSIYLKRLNAVPSKHVYRCGRDVGYEWSWVS